MKANAAAEALREARTIEINRYRDFNRVFFGNSGPEEGKRVLEQILKHVQGPKVEVYELNNHALMAVRAWGLRITQDILGWATKPPPELEE